MVVYEEGQPSPVRRRKRDSVTDKSVEENPNAESTESFLICEDCRHNSIRYDPARDGACDCGCH
jgi:hypothetical protein